MISEVVWWQSEDREHFSGRMTKEILAMEKEFFLDHDIEYDLPATDWDVRKLKVRASRPCELDLFDCPGYDSQNLLLGWKLYFKMEDDPVEWKMWVLYRPDYLKGGNAPPIVVFPNYPGNDSLIVSYVNHVSDRQVINNEVYPVACLYYPHLRSKLYLEQKEGTGLAVNHAKIGVLWFRAHLAADKMGVDMLSYVPDRMLQGQMNMGDWIRALGRN